MEVRKGENVSRSPAPSPWREGERDEGRKGGREGGRIKNEEVTTYLDVSKLAEGSVRDGLDGAVARFHELVQVGPVDAVVLQFRDVPEVDHHLVEGREGGRGEEEEEEEEEENEEGPGTRSEGTTAKATHTCLQPPLTDNLLPSSPSPSPSSPRTSCSPSCRCCAPAPCCISAAAAAMLIRAEVAA